MLDNRPLRRAGIDREEDECHRLELGDVRFIDSRLMRHDAPVQDVVLAEEVVDLRRLLNQLGQSGGSGSTKRVVRVQDVVIVEMDLTDRRLSDLVKDVRASAAEPDDGDPVQSELSGDSAQTGPACCRIVITK